MDTNHAPDFDRPTWTETRWFGCWNPDEGVGSTCTWADRSVCRDVLSRPTEALESAGSAWSG